MRDGAFIAGLCLGLAACLCGAALMILLYRDGYFPLSWLPV